MKRPSAPKHFLLALAILFAHLSIARADFLVAWGFMHRFSEIDGSSLGLAPYDTPYWSGAETLDSMVFAPDGYIYVTGNVVGTGSVIRYDGATGRDLGFIVPQDFSSDFTMPQGIGVGTNGDIYVLSERYWDSQLDRVFQFDGKTGQFKRKVISEEAGLRAFEMQVGPDGNLYILDSSRGVKKYSADTGNLLGSFIPPSNLRRIVFGPDGQFYGLTLDPEIRRYDGVSGALLKTVVPATNLHSSTFYFDLGPDGTIYTLGTDSTIRKYNAKTGASNGIACTIISHFGVPHGFVLTRARISASATGAQTTFTWPLTHAKFQLQSRSDFDPTTPWQIHPGVPTTNATNISLTILTDETQKFFRLRALEAE